MNKAITKPNPWQSGAKILPPNACNCSCEVVPWHDSRNKHLNSQVYAPSKNIAPGFKIWKWGKRHRSISLITVPCLVELLPGHALSSLEDWPQYGLHNDRTSTYDRIFFFGGKREQLQSKWFFGLGSGLSLCQYLTLVIWRNCGEERRRDSREKENWFLWKRLIYKIVQMPSVWKCSSRHWGAKASRCLYARGHSALLLQGILISTYFKGWGRPICKGILLISLKL